MDNVSFREGDDKMNSQLVAYTRLSPNHSGKRKYPVTRITPHCTAGKCTIEALGDLFSRHSRMASSNYGIDENGRVGLFVPEEYRSWCSSNADNDNRAITVECSSGNTHPYEMNGVVYGRLIDLCADICRRYGKKRLIWIPDKTAALAYTPSSDEMLLTVHRWFALKACPGDWLYARLVELADEVTLRLGGTQNPVVFKPYKVLVSISDLNIRYAPNARAKSRGYTGKGVFTIVDESSGWGLLKTYKKNRDGWIRLSYTKKI